MHILCEWGLPSPSGELERQEEWARQGLQCYYDQAKPGQGQQYLGNLEVSPVYRAHIKPVCGALWPLGFLSLCFDLQP